MILEKLRLKLWIRRLKHKGKILYFARATGIGQQLANMKTVCICMPDDHKYFYEARSCVQEITRKDVHITLVLNRELELLAEHSGGTEVYPTPLPRPFPISEEKVKHIPSEFDVALDLSPQPTPLTAYITGTRGKKLTAGLKSPDLDAFYTVIIHRAESYRESIMTMLSASGLLEE
jgi:hypothetical protein